MLDQTTRPHLTWTLQRLRAPGRLPGGVRPLVLRAPLNGVFPTLGLRVALDAFHAVTREGRASVRLLRVPSPWAGAFDFIAGSFRRSAARTRWTARLRTGS
jgi:hypothetical protein